MSLARTLQTSYPTTMETSSRTALVGLAQRRDLLISSTSPHPFLYSSLIASTLLWNECINPASNSYTPYLHHPEWGAGTYRLSHLLFHPRTNIPNNSGDGRADYIRIEANGAMDLYTNEVGNNPSFFVPQPQAASGVGAPGPTIQFGILTSSGRADYIPVVQSSGAIYPWLNGCK